jgi:hypothetical protein
MQDNSIDITDPVAGVSLVVVSRHEEQLNRSTYITPTHTPSNRGMVQLYRTPSKRAGSYLGTSKTMVKVTNDTTVPNADGSGNVVTPIIMELSASVPVGTSEADRELALKTLVGFFFDETTTVLTDHGTSLQATLEI